MPYTECRRRPAAAAESATESTSKLNWDLSPTYALAQNVNLYVRVATGFRAPSFGAPAAGPPPVPVQVAKSENNISYEIGIKAETPDRRASVAFDVYYFHVTDQQLTAVGGAANVTQLLNAKDTYGRGAELELDVHPLPQLLVNMSGSYNYTRIDDPTLAVGSLLQLDLRRRPLLHGAQPAQCPRQSR